MSTLKLVGKNAEKVTKRYEAADFSEQHEQLLKFMPVDVRYWKSAAVQNGMQHFCFNTGIMSKASTVPRK